MFETIIFFVLAGMAITSALLVISRVNPLISALWLAVCLASVAGLFATLGATFLAVLQLLVYAGAIAVLFIFVVMLIDLGPQALKMRLMSFRNVFATMATLYFGLLIFINVARFSHGDLPSNQINVTPKILGQLLLTKYAVPFELASLLLTVAVVGAVVLAKKKL